jgi:hypothetical protein
VLDLGTKLNIQNGDVSEENGVLKIKGTAKTQYEKNIIWDEIKAVGGQNPSDIQADIRVSDESVYHRHTVKSGETLGKIAKHYVWQSYEIQTDFSGEYQHSKKSRFDSSQSRIGDIKALKHIYD